MKWEKRGKDLYLHIITPRYQSYSIKKIKEGYKVIGTNCLGEIQEVDFKTLNKAKQACKEHLLKVIKNNFIHEVEELEKEYDDIIKSVKRLK
jgi:hypothetical protein